MSEITFARPEWLALSIVPILALFVRRFLNRRTAQRWAKLGNPLTLRQFVSNANEIALWRIALMVLAWLSGTVALAGPRWGLTESSGVAVGRDIVIVLDFSRSMWAEDVNDAKHPARWQAALEAAKDHVRSCKARGGDRLAIVVFAAQPIVIAPLTTDYDHLLLRLDALDARTPPAEILPPSDTAASGTRIGAALAAAVALHEDRFTGFQEIVLITDADDPAQDSEWRTGASAARTANIPVHVIGLGDPVRESFILREGMPLEGLTSDGVRSQIRTRQHDDVAKAIALETRGAYVAANTSVPKPGDFSNRPSREFSEDPRTQPRDRSAVFTAVTMLLLSIAWLWPKRSI